jgi:hypothetical protein
LGCVRCSVGLLQSIQVTPGGRYDDCYDQPLMRLRSTSEVCDQSVYRPIWLERSRLRCLLLKRVELHADRYSSRPTGRSAEAKQLLSCGCAHYRVQPNVARRPRNCCLSEEGQKRLNQRLSWSFFPLRRLSPSESTPRRLATPTTFRPQGFAPSRRLSPRSNARPCFMPVTSMGFALQGFSLAVRSCRLVTRKIALLTFLLRKAQ